MKRILETCPKCKRKNSYYTDGHEGVCYICGYSTIKKKPGRKPVVIGIYHEDVVMYDMYREAAWIYIKELFSGSLEAKRAMEYLNKRGYTETDIRRFGIGYAPYGDRLCSEFLKTYGKEHVERSGLFSTYYDGTIHDMFRGRIMIPILDEKKRVIAFGGRTLGNKQPKYLNSPETTIFSKRKNLFGLMPKTGRKNGTVLVCEGYMDCLAIKKAGFKDVVATLGTAMTETQVKKLAERYNNVYISFDSDAAGIQAAKRAIGMLEGKKMNIKIPSYLPYKDPDELLQKAGKDEFLKRLNEAVSVKTFLQHNASPEEIVEALLKKEKTS